MQLLARFLVGALLIVGCTQRDAGKVGAGNIEKEASAEALQGGATDGLMEGKTASGSWRVKVRPSGGAVPLNEMFSVDVWVAPNHPETEADEVTVDVDAAMPGHGHGMNTRPAVRMVAAGHYRAEGMLFHMPGYWELYVDVGEAGMTERVVFEVELD